MTDNPDKKLPRHNPFDVAMGEVVLAQIIDLLVVNCGYQKIEGVAETAVSLGQECVAMLSRNGWVIVHGEGEP